MTNKNMYKGKPSTGLLKVDLQLHAEKNIIKRPDMGTAKDIDFIQRFAYSLNNLQKMLGFPNKYPLSQGNKLTTYKFEVTRPTGVTHETYGVVGEGEDIPLTHVKKLPDREWTVDLRKYRKAVTAEEIQRIGYDAAVNKSDAEVLLDLQKDVRKRFMAFLSSQPKNLGKVGGMQQAFAQSWGQLNDIFDGDASNVLVFINPLDAADYLGEAVMNNGASIGFGLTLLQNFTNVTPVIFNDVPRGKTIATLASNLNMAYINTRGEIAKTFINKTPITDVTGLIGMVKDDNTTNMTNQSVLFTGVTLFTEVTNGVVLCELGEAITEG